MKSYQDLNAETIDRWVDNGWQWGIPITHEEYEEALKGNWEVKLTPSRYVPKHWFGDLNGKKVLGLASGGGQQMPLFTAAKANCTVLDYSMKQLESERMVALREGYDIEIVHADMTKRLPFDDESFDFIFHPVSNDYIQDVYHVFNECYRVLKKNGVLVCGLSKEVNYFVSDDGKQILYKMPFDPLENEEYRKLLEKEDSGMQFSHTLEEQIGGQIKAGFILKDLYEDIDQEGYLHDMNIKTFLATYAIK